MNHSTLCSSMEPKKDISPEGLPAKLGDNPGQLRANLKGGGRKAALVAIIAALTLVYSGCSKSHQYVIEHDPSAPHQSQKHTTTEEYLDNYLKFLRNEDGEEKYDKNY